MLMQSYGLLAKYPKGKTYFAEEISPYEEKELHLQK